MDVPKIANIAARRERPFLYISILQLQLIRYNVFEIFFREKIPNFPREASSFLQISKLVWNWNLKKSTTTPNSRIFKNSKAIPRNLLKFLKIPKNSKEMFPKILKDSRIFE